MRTIEFDFLSFVYKIFMRQLVKFNARVVKRKDYKGVIYLSVEDLKFYKSQKNVPNLQILLLKDIMDDKTVPECLNMFFLFRLFFF
jgi:hypothetical protein